MPVCCGGDSILFKSNLFRFPSMAPHTVPHASFKSRVGVDR
jgi:hypothetical protein